MYGLDTRTQQGEQRESRLGSRLWSIGYNLALPLHSKHQMPQFLEHESVSIWAPTFQSGKSLDRRALIWMPTHSIQSPTSADMYIPEIPSLQHFQPGKVETCP